LVCRKVSRDPRNRSLAADECSDLDIPSNDTCASISVVTDATQIQLLSWNTALDCSNIQPDYYICIGVSSPSSKTSSSIPIASTTSPANIPSPVQVSHSDPCGTHPSEAYTDSHTLQSSISPSCRRYYFVQPGDGCYAISQSAGIALTDFYAMNPAVGQCTDLEAFTYVCIGLHGSGTTITSGTAVPATGTGTTPSATLAVTTTAPARLASPTPSPAQVGHIALTASCDGTADTHYTARHDRRMSSILLYPTRCKLLQHCPASRNRLVVSVAGPSALCVMYEMKLIWRVTETFTAGMR
jgi:hypothetical protein